MPTQRDTPRGVIRGGDTQGWTLPLIAGSATPEGTRRFHGSFPRVPGRTRDLDGLTLSSVGLGNYLGKEDDIDDALFRAAALRAMQLGANVLDTAISYRCQRSERALGAALRDAISDGTITRDQVFVSSKAAYIPFEGNRPADIDAFVDERWIIPGLATRDEVVSGVHCIAAAYLDDQIERSRRNLGLETIDLYYLHNPETHLGGTSRELFFTRLLDAFVALEQACRDGRIGRYGVATWHGFRRAPGEHIHHPLGQFLQLAEAAADQVGGGEHHLRVVQLPVNLAMIEAYSTPTQPPIASARKAEDQPNIGATAATDLVPFLDAAISAGVHVMASAPLLQGQLTARLPADLRHALDAGTESAGVHFEDPQRALQFARSAPGITTALVGTRRVERVEENLRVLSVPALDAAAIRRIHDDNV